MQFWQIRHSFSFRDNNPGICQISLLEVSSFAAEDERERAVNSQAEHILDVFHGNLQLDSPREFRLFEELKTIKWLKTVPSQANFILCRVEKGDAKELKQKLQQKGILVRYFEEPRLKDYIRISVGKPEHTDALIKALERF